jgi:hypothetical protein
MTKRHQIAGTALTLLLCGAAVAADVPLNTGLWEMQMTVSMAGIQIPPEAIAKMKAMGMNPPGQASTQTRQMCVTEQTLAKFGDMSNANDKCRQENAQKSARGMSFDIVCTSPQNNGRGHVDIVFDDRTHAHGSFHMSGTHATSSGQSIPVDLDGTQTGRWLSNDCGAVKPMN